MQDPGLEYTGFPDANNEIDFQERWRIAADFLGSYFISERLGKRRNIYLPPYHYFFDAAAERTQHLSFDKSTLLSW